MGRIRARSTIGRTCGRLAARRPFWGKVVGEATGPVRTWLRHGPLSLPLAQARVQLVGVDRSAGMLGARRAISSSGLRRRRQTATALRRLFAPTSVRCRLARAFEMVPRAVQRSCSRCSAIATLAATLRSPSRVLGAGRPLRHRPCARRAQVARMTRIACSCAGRSGRAPPDPDRIRPAGSPAAVTPRSSSAMSAHRAARASAKSVEHRFELIFRTLPMPPDDSPSRARRVRSIEARSATIAAGPGTPAADTWLILARRLGLW